MHSNSAPPLLQVEKMSIEFNAAMSSTVQTASTSASQYSKTTTSNGGSGFWFWRTSWQSTSSYAQQRTNSNSQTQTISYSLNVKVDASQADIPAGMARVLGLLEESILISAGATALKA